MVKERERVFDALKLFAIFLVLWGHSVQYLVSTNFYDEPVYRVIYSFHMPLFMAIVGYFSFPLLNLSFWSVIVKKGRQLLLPAGVFGLMFFVLGVYRIGGVKQGINLWVESFWFLKSAFFCCLLFYVSFKFVRPLWVGIFLSLIVSQTINYYQLYLMYPSFVFGLLLNKNINLVRSYSGLFSLFSGIIFVSMLLFWNASFWKVPDIAEVLGSISDTALAKVYAYRVGYRIVIGIAGIMFFVSLFEFLSVRIRIPEKIKSLSRYGADTLGVYLLQTLILELFLGSKLRFDSCGFAMFNFVITPAVSLATFVVCIFLIRIIGRSSVLSFFLLGKALKSPSKTVS